MPEELQGSWLLVDEFLLWEAERALSKLLRQINHNLGGAAAGAGPRAEDERELTKVVVEFSEQPDAALAVGLAPSVSASASASRQPSGAPGDEVIPGGWI